MDGMDALSNPAPGATESIPGPVVGMQGSPTMASAGATPTAQPAAPDPHARLKSMIQGMFVGMDAFGKSIATGGREGGVQEVQAVQQRQQQARIQQQAAQREQESHDMQIKAQQAAINMSTAQLNVLLHNAPLETQKLVLDNQHSVVEMLTQLGIPPSLSLPILEGQSTDAHVQALGQKAGGDFVNNAIVATHDDKFGGPGNSYGFDFGKLHSTMVPLEKAGPMLATLQNTVDAAKGVLGGDDPAVKVAQGRLDLFRGGDSASAADLLGLNQMVTSQVLGRMQAKEQTTKVQTEQADLKAKQQANDPLFKLENDPNEMAGEKSSAAVAMLTNKMNDPLLSANDKVRTSRLLSQATAAHRAYLSDVYAKAAAEQQTKQGNPADAGALLARGDLTLADLKTRGTTPAFIEQAITAAQKIDPGYRAADEIIAEQQAKSPANLQFFGSANSLIQKGGTLDQLKQAGANIPNAQMPVFNKLADYLSYETGKDKLPPYQATALGVADDYAKVMGGGQGSDSARMQVYNSIAASLNSGQREQVANAMSRAVGSQVESRIGNNKFMMRIYGYGLTNIPKVESGSGGKEIHYKIVNGQLVQQ